MKVTDLMVGDLVEQIQDFVSFAPIQIEEVRKDYVVFSNGVCRLKYDEIAPIPLTEDILVKNGFSYEEDTFLPDTGYWSLSDEDGMLYFTIDAYGVKGSGEVAFGYQVIALEYVHQLQHLIRLCGIEKEITI